MATNSDKMLQAVLLDEKLQQFGNYTYKEIGDIYQSLCSDNCVINTVAQIIKGVEDGTSEKDLWKAVNEYLKKNV